ncbi:MAG TPA: PH domain-containing protein [Acidimicrobiales bacterium]|nr:PH domain-containing protein [Acidimicrobiales bacterium]
MPSAPPIGLPSAPPIRPDEQEWHRLHPLSAVVRASRTAWVVVLGLVLDFSSRSRNVHTDVITGIILIVIVAGLGVISWAVTQWRIEGDVLRIDSGLIRRDSERLPLSQIQAVDLVAPGMARALGLAELRVRMAGNAQKAGRLSYLPVADAEQLRARFMALAHGVHEDTPPPPETPLLQVRTGALVASLILGPSGAVIALLVIAVVVLVTVAPSAIGAVFAAGGAGIIGLLTSMWRRFNSGYRLTVAEAADGLRMRSGLVQTTAETIPFGRIQAVRLAEPLLWRPFGWCRVMVDVAGRQRQGRENQSEGHSLRHVLPVGTAEEAAWLLHRLVPDAPTDRHPAPPRVRWKSPLRYHHLGWAANERCAVTTSGRVRRVTDWVPLAKVQSIRRVDGPLQRALNLASIHLDTAGRGIDATIRDRDAGECDEIMRRLPDACRSARRADAAAPRRVRRRRRSAPE